MSSFKPTSSQGAPSSQRAPDSVRTRGAPPGLLVHYVSPGNLVVAREPTSAITILGSCVAICLWEPSLRVGGLNHYLLPRSSHGQTSSGRFGDTALQLLLARLAELGAPRRSLLARVVGGACMISAFRERESHLGRQNVEMGLALLGEAGIRVVQRDTGGSQGRKLIFRTDDGSAVIQPL